MDTAGGVKWSACSQRLRHEASSIACVAHRQDAFSLCSAPGGGISSVLRNPAAASQRDWPASRPASSAWAPSCVLEASLCASPAGRTRSRRAASWAQFTCALHEAGACLHCAHADRSHVCSSSCKTLRARPKALSAGGPTTCCRSSPLSRERTPSCISRVRRHLAGRSCAAVQA